MDYKFIKNLIEFLKIETINAKNGQLIPLEWTPLLKRMGFWPDSYEDITCNRQKLTDNIELIAIHDDTATAVRYKPSIYTAFIDNNFTQGIFIFDGHLRNNSIDVLLKHETDIREFLLQWNDILMKVLEILGISKDQFNSGDYSVLSRQLTLLPAYVLTHMNPRVNNHFQTMDPEYVLNNYQNYLHIFFPNTPMIDKDAHKLLSIKLSNIAKDDNPFLNCL